MKKLFFVTQIFLLATFASQLVAQGQIFLNTVASPVKCFGESSGSVDLSVTGGVAPYTYLWSNNANTQDISNLTAGTYTVTVSGANGQTATAAASVGQPSPLVVSYTTTPANCNNANGAIDVNVFGGTPGYTYNWGTGFSSIQDPSFLTAGNYPVTVMDGNGCTKTLVITVPGSAGLVPIIGVTFSGNVATFTGSANGATGWSWQFPGGTPSSSNLQNPMVNYPGPGGYQAFLSVYNCDCGVSSTYQAVTVPGCQSPTAAFGFADNNGTVSFQNFSTNGTNYSWNFGDGTGSAELNPVHTFTLSGNYNVRLITTNNCGADTIFHSVSVTITPPCVTPIVIYESPDVTIEKEFGSYTVLSVQTPNPNDEIEWFPHLGSFDPFSGWTSFNYHISFSYLQLGQNEFTYIVKNGTCWTTGKVIVTLVEGSPTPVVNPIEDVATRLFPNPTRGVATLERGDLSETIDLSNEPSGSYILTLYSIDGRLITRKLVKE